MKKRIVSRLKVEKRILVGSKAKPGTKGGELTLMHKGDLSFPGMMIELVIIGRK
jgi:hypothetical protein